MAARKCPDCLTSLSAGEILSRSNDLVCPGCGKSLEVSGFSRNLAAFAGLAGAWVVWKLSSNYYSITDGPLGWILPIVSGILAFGIISPLVLLVLADLRWKPAPESHAYSHHELSVPSKSH